MTEVPTRTFNVAMYMTVKWTVSGKGASLKPEDVLEAEHVKVWTDWLEKALRDHKYDPDIKVTCNLEEVNNGT